MGDFQNTAVEPDQDKDFKEAAFQHWQAGVEWQREQDRLQLELDSPYLPMNIAGQRLLDAHMATEGFNDLLESLKAENKSPTRKQQRQHEEAQAELIEAQREYAQFNEPGRF